jgi:hypothetical protein
MIKQLKFFSEEQVYDLLDRARDEMHLETLQLVMRRFSETNNFEALSMVAELYPTNIPVRRKFG